MRRAAISSVIIAAVACALLAATAGAGSPAHAARTCKPPKYPGTGYFTSLSVSGTSCATGDRLAVAYYRCRIRHGAKGRCTSRVLGYRCHETRNSIPTEIDARVTCQNHSRRVVHTYQQDT